MEIKQLEIFACVARNLSFSKAAEELFISQPSVSAQISALEKALGTQLFARNTKEVSLTKTGLVFLAYAQKILSLRDQAVQGLKGEDRGASGTIDIVSSTIPAQHLLPEIIASFQKQWPNIVFRLEQADSQRAVQRMSSFRYDFGMVGTAPDASRFVCYPVFDDELVLAVPKGVRQRSESIRENFSEFMLRTPFVMREAGSGTRKEIETLLAKIGVDTASLRVPAYFSDAHSILLAVSCGMGASLVSKVAAKMYVDAGLIEAVEMGDPLFRRQIYLIHNKEVWLPPVQQAFADHARQFFMP
ncbi:MAG: selenium metabolism-associated LysR family transcriptional regulator [Clostridiales bacterium]|nr:selenium metabolism-associated LysR family transcriptional regulator [Clostridiales bacterium]